jgi:hypothetical protein
MPQVGAALRCCCELLLVCLLVLLNAAECCCMQLAGATRELRPLSHLLAVPCQHSSHDSHAPSLSYVAADGLSGGILSSLISTLSSSSADIEDDVLAASFSSSGAALGDGRPAAVGSMLSDTDDEDDSGAEGLPDGSLECPLPWDGEDGADRPDSTQQAANAAAAAAKEQR